MYASPQVSKDGKSLALTTFYSTKCTKVPYLTLTVPHSVAVCHYIIVSFEFLAQQVFTATCISWVKCISERFTVEKVFFDG